MELGVRVFYMLIGAAIAFFGWILPHRGDIWWILLVIGVIIIVVAVLWPPLTPEQREAKRQAQQRAAEDAIAFRKIFQGQKDIVEGMKHFAERERERREAVGETQPEPQSGGSNWLGWLIFIAAIMAAIWFFFLR